MSTDAKTAVTPQKKTFDLLKGPLIAYSLVFGLYAALMHGKWSWFSWHPFCMLLAFFACAGNAALIKKVGGYDNTKTHGTLMFAALALGLFAWYVIYSNKELYGKPHLTSNHGKTGFVVMVAYLAFGAVGTVCLNPDFGIAKNNKLIRAAHKYGGRVFTALAWLVCISGFSHMVKNPLLRAAFVLPMLAFGYFTLL